MMRVSALPPRICFTSTEAVWRAVFLAGKKRVAKEVLADEQALMHGRKEGRWILPASRQDLTDSTVQSHKIAW